MDPERRRELIVRAALPLVIEFGTSVTTAQIARAAGIGEGTIFRAFGDKDALLDACVTAALLPDDTLAQLAGISLDQPLAARLVEAAEALAGYLARMGAVVGALAASGGRQSRPNPEGRAAHRAAASSEALVALFEPEREKLRIPPERLADTFHFLVMSAGRGAEAGASSAESWRELVDLFLYGALTTSNEE
jgi:AcrR family transcriptional regulator